MTRLLALLIALASGCASSSIEPPDLAEPPAPADYRYVVLGPDGAPMARVITSAATCPAIEIDGVSSPMSVRMPPETIPVRPSRSAPPKPSAFPVLTCEAALAPSARSASIDGQALPLLKADPQRIVLLGDTGCRVIATYGALQACSDPSRWPFEKVANAAALAKPDLVIHVGDYHYRETPCPQGNAGCAGTPWGYGWDAWRADLFHPARNLLAAAPWIVVRGNHESCERAGQGWWRFLDPREVMAQRNCNQAANDDVGDYSDAYAVPLGPEPHTQFLIFDSAAVTDDGPPLPAGMLRNYREELERAFALAARGPRAWFLSHHPVLGFASNPRQPDDPFPGNRRLQAVLQTLYPDVFFPAAVDAVLSGHNHVLEIVGFSSPHPPQLITGNGGTLLDRPFPVPFPSGARVAPTAVVNELTSATRFGFATMERDGAGWHLEARDVDGRRLTTCTLAARNVACSPISP